MSTGPGKYNMVLTHVVSSKDGTTIAFDQSGKGPAIILVVGAFNDRATGAPLARFLEQHFTVFNYDRRGRGESGDAAAYAIEAVGIPPAIVAQMQNAPFRRALEKWRTPWSTNR